MTLRRATIALWATLLALFVLFALLPCPCAAQGVTQQCIVNVAAQGTPDAITSAQLPCGTTTNLVLLTAAAANVTTTPTYAPVGSPPLVIIRATGGPVQVGDIVGAGYVAMLASTGSAWVLLNPGNLTLANAALLGANNAFTGTNSFTINPTFFGCVGYPLSTGAGPFGCSTTVPVGSVGGLGTGVASALGQGLCAGKGFVSTANNNTQLAALSTAVVGCVVRMGFATLGDAPPVAYVGGASCPYNSGVAEGGSCVSSSDAKFWVLQKQPVLDSSEWGVSTAQSDNAPFLTHMFNFAAVNGGQSLFTTGPGTFLVASTFNCANASGWEWKGAGNATVIDHVAADYGSTFSCGDASHFPQSIRVADMWFYHDIGMPQPAIPANFINPTTNSAHFDFINVSHFVFDHVTEWNLNVGWRIIQCIDGTWIDPQTAGYWDGTHNQTVADFFFDGQDGTGLGHPQIMKIHDATMQGYFQTLTKTFTSGSFTTSVSFNQELSAFDHIVVRSMEGLQIDGGYGASGAYNSSLHIQPQGVAGKVITNIISNGVWWDGAGNSDVLIENQALSVCSDPNTFASNVIINGGIFNGELSSLNSVLVPNNTCPTVKGLFINNAMAVATVKTPYSIGGAVGGQISGGSVRNYNVFGVYANDAAAGSAVWLFGQTANFDVNGLKVGGDNSYTNAPATAVANAAVNAGGSGYGATATGTMTWAGGGCSVNPVINVTTNGGGVITTVNSVTTAGTCATAWPRIAATTWTAGGGLSAGTGAQFALAPAFNSTNNSMFGVSIAGGLVGVTREAVSNGGYYQDYPTQQVSCTLGAGAPTLSAGYDNRHGTLTTAAGSGAVTSGTCAFSGALMSTANVACHVTDAVTSGGTPVAGSASGATSGGFNVTFASSIGAGGSFSYVCDSSN